ncbi:MAG: hypothetical protein ACI9A8_001502, partial [Cryomorphaceae bacterium]
KNVAPFPSIILISTGVNSLRLNGKVYSPLEGFG